MRLRFNTCKHEWQPVPLDKYTIKDRLSLGRMNPMLQLIECKHCKVRKWVYKNLNK